MSGSGFRLELGVLEGVVAGKGFRFSVQGSRVSDLGFGV